MRRSLRVVLFGGAAAAFFAVSYLALPAFANHGDLPRLHWESGKRLNIKVYNRANEPTVARAIADWNAATGGLVTLDPKVVTGGDPHDCSQPPDGIAVCYPTTPGNAYAAWAVYGTQEHTHIRSCVVGLPVGGWEGDYAAVAHETGHCFGLGHHLDERDQTRFGGGIMGGEGRITQVDTGALRTLYGSHTDQAPPPPVAAQPVAAQPAAPQPGLFQATATPAAYPPTVVASPMVWGYSCADARAVQATTADLGGVTNDAGASKVTVTVTRNGAAVGSFTAMYPFRVTASGLAPSTSYAYTVTFDPGAHLQQGQPCTFTTQAAPSAAPAPPAVAGAPAASSPAAPANATTPPKACAVLVAGLCLL